jgi:hypothetical protein
MRKSAGLAGIVAVSASLMFFLGSCDVLLGPNIFKKLGLGQVQLADVKTVADIKAAATSPGFYADLGKPGNEATKDTMLGTLIPSYTPGTKLDAVTLTDALSANTGADLAAAETNLVLGASIIINTTEGGTIVQNIAGQMPTIASTGITKDNLGSVLAGTLPASVKSDPVAFAAAIDALISASGAFSAIAAVEGPTGNLPLMPGSSSVQDTAYYGLVSLAVASITPTGAYAGKSTSDVLFDLVNGKGTATSSNLSVPSNLTSTGSINTLLLAGKIDISALKF